MNCPECDHANVHTHCVVCGWKAQPEPGEKKKKGHDSPPPLKSVQCVWLTGTYRCHWGRMTREGGRIYCPFHDRALQQRATTAHEQWDLLLAEREYMQTHYPFTHALEPDDLTRYARGRVSSGSYCEEDGRRAVLYVPFWYQSIEQQWRALTGLPVPALASVAGGAG